MQNITNKKALSGAITAILLVTLSVAAIAIIGISINNLTKTQLSPETSCIDYQTSNILTIINSCFDPEKEEVKVSLSRSAGSPSIDSIKFNFIFESGLAESYEAGGSCKHCTIVERGDSKTYSFSMQEKPSSVSINALSCNLKESDITLC